MDCHRLPSTDIFDFIGLVASWLQVGCNSVAIIIGVIQPPDCITVEAEDLAQ